MILAALIPLGLGVSASGAQEDAAIEEVRAAWAACTELMDRADEDWTGWRRNFDGGYGDSFQFWDRTYDGTGAAVLKQSFLIDAIAVEYDTSCYRADGTLAFIFTEMTSPNMAEGFEGPAITRQGRIYFSPQGAVLRVLGQIVLEGKVVAPMDNADYQLARGCGGVEVHFSVADVLAHQTAELGDIEGDHPPFEAERLDWCAELVAP